MNIEHRTLNVQHRIMYSVYFIKKTERSDSTLRHSTFDILRFCGSLFSGSAVFRSRLQRDSLVLKSIKRSVINIRCSMLDVRCSTFNLFTVSDRRSFIRPHALCPCALPHAHALCALPSHRQLNDKFGTMGNVILNADNTVMISNNGADNGKTQSHAGLFGRKIRLKQACFVLI